MGFAPQCSASVCCSSHFAATRHEWESLLSKLIALDRSSAAALQQVVDDASATAATSPASAEPTCVITNAGHGAFGVSDVDSEPVAAGALSALTGVQPRSDGSGSSASAVLAALTPICAVGEAGEAAGRLDPGSRSP